jgi:beta-glucanase (GH16 family)
MRRLLFCSFLAATLLAQEEPKFVLWSDDFNGPAGSPPDPSKWTYDLGGGGWGNGEKEVYTNDPANAFQDGQGHLVIRALRTNGGYTSARIKTQDRVAFRHEGKTPITVEARIKIPYAQGIWPAFWMMGNNLRKAHWPQCGEVDIMENFGKRLGDGSINHATVHGPGYTGDGITAKYVLPDQQLLSDDFHTYSIKWSKHKMEFFVDGHSYSTVTPDSIPPLEDWVFERPFFVLLNVAVGGERPADPDQTTEFPQDMLVDYVRVYANGTPAKPDQFLLVEQGVKNDDSAIRR